MRHNSGCGQNMPAQDDPDRTPELPFAGLLLCAEIVSSMNLRAARL